MTGSLKKKNALWENATTDNQRNVWENLNTCDIRLLCHFAEPSADLQANDRRSLSGAGIR